MKKILLNIILLLSLSANAQIINLEEWDGTRVENAYFKDINNFFNQFEGTYTYSNGTTELTIVFKKFTNWYNSGYYEDLLAGEVKFIKDGDLKFDNLSRINQNLSNKYQHHIIGNSIITPLDRPVCADCLQNQKRAKLIFFGRENNFGGTIFLQKLPAQIGQPEKIKIFILYST
ncbi:MAG: DUF6705 family protein, partial [Candidatus Paceibacterota bacterium]